MENKQATISTTIEKNYDSEFCGSIPLHLVNLIQPHGVLLVLDPNDLRIVQVSENVGQLLGIPAAEILNEPVSRFLPEHQFEDIRAKMQGQNSSAKIPFSVTFLVHGQEVIFTALVHPKEGYVLVELENNQETSSKNSFLELYQQINYITSLLKQAGSISEIAQISVEEIKKLTGFDRVLAYQFDPQWNGIVIGQAKEEDMDDFMDLRFPASDVPKQSRDLYFSNPYRLIPTRSYTPVKLMPLINPLTLRFTDLSDCNLRSVAPVHLEYLVNLKVMASMSVPLIIDNKLWGLISFHHKTEKNPSYELRSALELLSGIISGQLAGKEREETIERRAHLRGIHAQLVEQLYTNPSLPDGLLSGATHLQQLLNLSGAAVLFEGGIWTSGQVPSNQELKELLYWLRRNGTDKLFATTTLPHQYVRARDYQELASGLIVLPINAEQGEYILGFRPEVLQTISWGGDPNQAIQMEPDGKTYHPRNSFATYQETVKQTSLPWLPEEVEAAESLRSAVLEKIIKERH
ncbi:GAF domain-containing protein [Rufibacter latericius]|uniref:GAF domain-containing protein n=1 Tax=Rufibacter latericius TaxID=2487040 RepID=A0A3M9MVB1_9BACT|nr:GAF domain-containing protein [Rufibacter latericius]RNI29125.1 GAF domain-containing protein [Rufibacter latericius]